MSNLRTKIEEKITNKYPISEDFFFFICDHKEVIRKSADQMYPSTSFKYGYRYSFRRYLRDSNCPEDLMWIAYIINNMKSIDSVTNKEVIFIPTRNQIDELVNVYRNLQSRK